MGDLIVDDSYATGDMSTAVDVLDPYTTYDFSAWTPRELLYQLVEDGNRTGEPESIEIAKRRCRDALMRLDPATKRFLNPQTYPVGLESGLAHLRERLTAAERNSSGRK